MLLNIYKLSIKTKDKKYIPNFNLGASKITVGFFSVFSKFVAMNIDYLSNNNEL